MSAIRLADLTPAQRAVVSSRLDAEHRRRFADERHAALPGPLVFVLPMPPTLTNSGAGRSRHWRALERERHAYYAECDMLLLTGKLPERPPYPFVRAHLRVDMVLRGAMDDENAGARTKWPVDWLVARRYLHSDRRTCLVRDGYPTQRVTRKEPATLTLTLTPMEP